MRPCSANPFALTLAACALAMPLAQADPLEGWFAFSMPPHGSEDSAVDMSWLNPEPAGAAGFVTVKDGHFVDGRGKRLRLLGTNFTFANAFPSKEQAPKIAFRLRQFGVNVVRFHHIDTSHAPRGLWTRDFSGFDPKQLDKLDWTIYQLKQHGIYSNINLHVSRTYTKDIRKLDRAFRYGKGLDNFFPKFIQMQRDYARMLLTHRNPYTKTTYANEPAVLCVELNNENSILTKRRNVLCALPEPYGPELTRQWRAWIRKRYGNTKALRAKWDETAEPIGEEMLTNRDFTKGTTRWTLEAPKPAEGTMQVADGPEPGMKAMRCELTKVGRLPWHFQLHQTGLDLKDGQAYTLSFRGKADPPRKVHVGVRMDCPPWKMSGLNEGVQFSKEWKQHAFTFKCREPIANHTRVSFNFQNEIGVCWVADVSLRPGGYIGLAQDQSIEANNITLPEANAAPTAFTDFWQFLVDTERDYVAGMMRYIKDSLKVRPLVIDTQASYGGIAGAHREATLSDFVDIHSYWQHPHFPGKPWDGGNWTIGNTSMISNTSGGTLFRLASYRVAGLPYTVSEYDHPAPSDSCAELFPMFASFGALQDWDALYQFCYGSAGDSAETTKLRGYFSLAPHPGKMAFLPIAAVMFRCAAVSPAPTQATLRVPETLPRTGNIDAKSLWQKAGLKIEDMLSQTMAVEFSDGGDVAYEVSARDAASQVQWDWSNPEQATYTVNAPAARAAVGFVGGKTIKLGDVTIETAKTERNWASIALAALDAKPISESKRVLLVAAGRVENTNMGWNEARNSVGRKWGGPPIIAEGIPAAITMPGRARASALGPDGKRKAAVDVSTADGQIVVKIGSEHRTLWYLIER